MADRTVSRREFVKTGAAGAAALMVTGRIASAGPPMPERALGRTGHKVRLFSLGGQATLEQPGRADDAYAIINRAIDLGVNYLDTAPQYGNGISLSYLGPVMAKRRREVFLASKTHDRTRDGSLRLLESNLKTLQTDHLDLWQLHNIQYDTQLEKIFAKGGAIEALQQARDQKMVRFLGITGHYDPDVLARGLERFDFDTILMALNASDRQNLSFIDRLLPLAQKKGLGIIGMKVPARGKIFGPGGLSTMREAMHYVLSHPVSTVIVGCDSVHQVEENVAAAAAFTPLSATELARIEGLGAKVEHEATWFKKGGTGWGADGIDDQNTFD